MKPRPGIRFTETMRGYVSTKVLSGFQEAHDQGRADNSPFEFTLTIVSEDVQETVSNPNSRAWAKATATTRSLKLREG